jgi:hypothetical protein
MLAVGEDGATRQQDAELFDGAANTTNNRKRRLPALPLAG